MPHASGCVYSCQRLAEVSASTPLSAESMAIKLVCVTDILPVLTVYPPLIIHGGNVITHNKIYDNKRDMTLCV